MSPIVEEPGSKQNVELQERQRVNQADSDTPAKAPYEERFGAWEQEQRNFQPATGEVDAAAFVKAQSEFLRTQTWFLTHGSEPGALVQYSLAQGAFIEAQRKMLEQLGVV